MCRHFLFNHGREMPVFYFGEDEVSHGVSCGVILVWLGWYPFLVAFFTGFNPCFAICPITRQTDFLVNSRLPIFTTRHNDTKLMRRL